MLRWGVSVMSVYETEMPEVELKEVEDIDDADSDEMEEGSKNRRIDMFAGDDDDLLAQVDDKSSQVPLMMTEEEDDAYLAEIENILALSDSQYPRFTLAKNKARFLRMVSWYRGKEEWIEVAPVSGVTKLFKQQTKELEGIRSSKLDYEMELETGTLTPSQRSYRRDELKMCRVQEKMAVHLIAKLQVKIKSGRR